MIGQNFLSREKEVGESAVNLHGWYQGLIANPDVVTKPLLIGEIGVNHNGSVENALALISMAKESGCDLVKFQKRTPSICVPEHKKLEMRETPWGQMTYFDYKEKIEFWEREFDLIDAHCKALEIPWSASAWDLPSQDFVSAYDLQFNKIASAMNTNLEFVKRVAGDGILTFLSTGMATYEDIDKSVDVFLKSGTPLVLLHTVSSYPAHENELNLSIIPKLKERYSLPVGYSGHESSVSPSIVAASLGAVVIERHITLDRTMWGTDQSASLEARGVSELASVLKKLPEVMGDGVKRFLDSEKKAATSLRYW
jgi:N-acetylneuraminate synthase